MTDKERKSCICTIKMLRNLAFNVHEVVDVIDYENCEKMISLLERFEPSAQPPKEIPKRVLWSGWKGCRDTRYKCPNCEKPVRNDDTYCHRCGQRLMFPHISFTDYVPGQKQDVIVRWDDE